MPIDDAIIAHSVQTVPQMAARWPYGTRVAPLPSKRPSRKRIPKFKHFLIMSLDGAALVSYHRKTLEGINMIDLNKYRSSSSRVSKRPHVPPTNVGGFLPRRNLQVTFEEMLRDARNSWKRKGNLLLLQLLPQQIRRRPRIRRICHGSVTRQ